MVIDGDDDGGNGSVWQCFCIGCCSWIHGSSFFVHMRALYLEDTLSIERSYCTSTRGSYIGVVIFYLYVSNDTSTGPDLGINTIPEVVGNNHQNGLNQGNNQFSLCHI